MRQLLLILVLAPVWSLAQICDIDYTQTAPGIYPDTMPVGYVNQPYNEDITFVLPLDTMGFPFTNFHIQSIALPIGLDWECNNSAGNCDYDPQVNQYGCVNVDGTPLLAGQYQVDVTVIADLSIAQGIPTTFSVFLEILADTASTSNNGFTMIGANGCASHTVEFINNNPGLLAYQWDFGNGNASTVENPVPQVYNAAGDYPVSYTAWNNLDTIDVYTLTGLNIQSMTGYGGGFPSFDDADAYYIIKDASGAVFSQSGVIADTEPPVSWTTNVLLDPLESYTIEIWESDAGEVLFGADDHMGDHPMSFNGCVGCAAGTAVIDYTITHQVILPSATVVSVDTVHVSDYPMAPIISFDSVSHTLSATDHGDAYQWYLNGSPVLGATSTNFVIDSSGYYSIVAINTGGCVTNSDSVLAIYCSPTYQPIIELNQDDNLAVTNAGNNSIQWYQDGIAITNDTTTIAVPSTSGTYSVIVEDAFGCSYESDPFSLTLNLWEKTNLQGWKIYPNPAMDVITIEMEGSASIERIEIIDVTGRTLLTEFGSTGSKQLNIDDLNDGAYIVRLTSQGRHWTRSLIVQK